MVLTACSWPWQFLAKAESRCLTGDSQLKCRLAGKSQMQCWSWSPEAATTAHLSSRLSHQVPSTMTTLSLTVWPSDPCRLAPRRPRSLLIALLPVCSLLPSPHSLLLSLALPLLSSYDRLLAKMAATPHFSRYFPIPPIEKKTVSPRLDSGLSCDFL